MVHLLTQLTTPLRGELPAHRKQEWEPPDSSTDSQLTISQADGGVSDVHYHPTDGNVIA